MTGVALDTSILAYSEGLVARASEAPRIAVCQALIRRILADGGRPVIAAAALAALHRRLVEEGGLGALDAGIVMARLARAGEVIATDAALLDAAADLAAQEGLALADALILAAADKGGARLLISQELAEGYRWRGVTVCDPFDPAADSPLFAWLG